MKILIVISKFPPEYSGPGVRIPKLYHYLQKELDIEELRVLTGSTEFDTSLEYEYEGFNVRRVVADFLRQSFLRKVLPKRVYDRLVYLTENILAQKKLALYKSYDLIHILGHNPLTASALNFARKNNIPVLQELVNASASPHQKYLFKKELIYKGKLITISSFLKEKALKAKLPEKMIWNRPNPIDTGKFNIPSDKPAYRSKIGNYGKNDTILLSIGKFIERKNQIFLLDVLEKLPENYKLILAGPTVRSGPNFENDKKYLQRIENVIQNRNLNKRVSLITDFVDSETYMKASDIYLLPGWNEGFGTPMFEAMACGLPVIANTEPSFQEWVKDGKNGFTISVDKPDMWANAVSEAFENLVPESKRISNQVLSVAGDASVFENYKSLIVELVSKEKNK